MGKKIGDINTEDIADISLDQLEKARGMQVQRERQEKIRQRKLESKRVDHLARAMREEEKSKLMDWCDEIEEQDNQFLDEAQERDEEEQFKNHEAGLAKKKQLIAFQEQKDKWVKEQSALKREAHNQAVTEKM